MLIQQKISIQKEVIRQILSEFKKTSGETRPK